MSIGSSSYSPSVNAAIKRQEALDRREKGFSLTGLQSVQLKEYNALYDPNMRHFFESRHNQYLLYRTGQIDSNGRVINLDKNKSKLAILEREFREAEKIEEKRQKEELEMRVSSACSLLGYAPEHADLVPLCLSIECSGSASTRWRQCASLRFLRNSRPSEI